MNPDLPPNSQPELEASLTALILGELPAEQAFALGRTIEKDAELAQLYERLKQTIRLVRETADKPAAGPAPLKLSEQRRAELLQRFKTVKPKEFVKSRRREMRWLEVAAVVAIIGILAAISLPNLSRSRFSSQRVSNRFFSRREDEPSQSVRDLSRDREPAGDVGLSQNARTESQLQETEAGPMLSKSAPADSAPAKAALSRIALPSSVEMAKETKAPAIGEDAKTGFYAIVGGVAPGSIDPATGLPIAVDAIQQGSLEGGRGGGSHQPNATAAAQTPPASGSPWGSKSRQLAYGRTPAAAIELPALGGASPTQTPLPDSNLDGQLSDLNQLGERTNGSNLSGYVFGGGFGGFTAGTPRGFYSDTVDGFAPGPAQKVDAPGNDSLALNNSDYAFRTWSLETGVANKQTDDLKPANTSAGKIINGGTLGLEEGKKDGTVPLHYAQASDLDLSKLAVIGGTAPSNVFDLNVVGYGNFPAQSTNFVVKVPNDSYDKYAFYRQLNEQNKNGKPAAETAEKPVEMAAIDSKREAEVIAGRQEESLSGSSEAFRRRYGGLAPSASATPPKIELPPASDTQHQNQGNVDLAAGLGQQISRSKLQQELRSSGDDAENSKPKRPETQANVTAGAANPPITDTVSSLDSPAMLMSSEELRKLEALRLQTKEQLAQEDSRLRRLKELSPDQLVQALPTSAPDSLLSSLLEQLTIAEQRQLQTEKNRGKADPETQKINTQVKDLRTKVNGRADGILLGLENRVGAEKDALTKLATEVEKAKTMDIADATRHRPYFEAKRKLDDLTRTKRLLDIAVTSEKVDKSIPTSAAVEIADLVLAKSDQNPSLWERLRRTVSGTVERRARVTLEPDLTDASGISEVHAVKSYDPYFIQTEFETIKSDAVLSKVLEKLNLNETWAKKRGSSTKLSTRETLQLLKKSLDLRSVPNTSFIEIGVKSDKPEEAAEIANAVAEAYRDYRGEQRKELSKKGIEALEERRAQQENAVARAQAEVDRLEIEATLSQADAARPKPAASALIPQPEVQTRENAYSTFSLNVSDVSFKLAGASLEKGLMPEPATVRSEEFINAFDYRDPEPPPGVPVAFAWERSGYPCAQNRDLLRFSIKTAALGRQAGRPLNLVLLLDNSGSMERADRVRIIHEALRVLATQLQPQDKLSVVTFARTPRLWVDGVPGSQAAQVAEDVSSLTPQGGTNLEDAMNLAYQTAQRHYLANGVNRVVLLTDGAANLGDVEPATLKQKVEAQRKQGIALDCFGIGWEGYNDDLLEVLSRNGDGRYGFLNSPEEAATEFAGQLAGALHIAASDVKVQVEFNPGRVTAYRQIGYARHQLTKEQFRDNTVDAAEIGAAESGNALYTIEVNPAGEGPLGTVRVRYKVPGTEEYHEHEWPVPYTGNAAPLEQSSSAMRLAATASAFSEWLVASPYAGEVTPDLMLGYLSGVPDIYGADARPKKLEWMIRQAKSVVGK
jgi:Mg-chelatase subunit ChlD/uncharacterized protein involved in exopolysaccharide biosynthesis/anti-sigma factor RsiW